jgi:hypothetical protein
LDTVIKADLDLDLDAVEHAARLVLEEQEEGKSVSSVTASLGGMRLAQKQEEDSDDSSTDSDDSPSEESSSSSSDDTDEEDDVKNSSVDKTEGVELRATLEEDKGV